MKILQINTTINSGSTGRITEEIGKLLISLGHESYIAYGRGNRPSESKKIKIGNKFSQILHLINTRLFDRHGFGSTYATKMLLRKIIDIKPDIIHLHNLHGYYINIKILFSFLKDFNKPVVWTLHDCWPFTGHCTYFDRYNCNKWQTECNKCPLKSYYPKSYFLDNSKNNYHNKKYLITKLDKIVFISPSKWLANHVQKSFLNKYDIRLIHNGIDLNSFSNKIYDRNNIYFFKSDKNKYILGAASTWDKRKGLNDFISLRKRLDENIKIILVGLNKKQIRNLPEGITGLEKTGNIQELATLYSSAEVFVNPTYVDNFPTTNIESIACGTPVVTYDSGGSLEAINEETGIVVKKGDIKELINAINIVLKNGKEYYSQKCRDRAVRYFNKDDRYQEYIVIYNELMKNSY